PRDELEARPPEGLAPAPLVRVDRLPARVLDGGDAALHQQVVELAARGTDELSGLRVLEQQLDRLGRVLLVRADHAARAALDPAGRVRPLRAGHAPAVVRDRPARLVERHARQHDAAVADAAQDERARNRLARADRARDDAAPLLHERVVDDLDPLDAL